MALETDSALTSSPFSVPLGEVVDKISMGFGESVSQLLQLLTLRGREWSSEMLRNKQKRCSQDSNAKPPKSKADCQIVSLLSTGVAN